MSAPPNAVFSTFAFIGTFLFLIPLYWHWGVASLGTCLYIFWGALGCLTAFVNSRVWNSTVLDRAPALCEITTRLIIAENVAIPAATLCITRRLHLITSDTAGTATMNKRREAIIDLCIGLGLPILNVSLSYIVQGHRYDIFEDVGCWPALYNTGATYGLVWSWPIILGVTSGCFGALALRSLIRRRRELNSFKSEATSDNFRLQKGLYARLLILALTDFIFTVPLGAYLLYLDRMSPDYGPWVNWAYVHWGFNRVDQFPRVLWRASIKEEATVEMSRWGNVLCAVIFFVLFGFAQEARRHYRMFWEWLRRVVSGERQGQYERRSSEATLPVAYNTGGTTVFSSSDAETRTLNNENSPAGDGKRVSFLDRNVTVAPVDSPISLEDMDRYLRPYLPP
ncbi:STE3-domain-containing protein [Artomyces pyxidatus]|uniref:STE3-domain-containing protein n=1 Tax=Artomyces pyxidatus TaxID=48021 RepID=A0ACB8SVH4_9AGAM|nr:STE3-domain-containing protein [Artomyces pyxidatus]